MENGPRFQIMQSPLAAWFALLMCLGSFANAQAAPIKIALVSDPHVSRGAEPLRQLYARHLQAVIAQVNDAKVTVVLIAGDLTEGGRLQEMIDFKEQIKPFHAPVLFVPGNHDVGGKAGADKGGTVKLERLQQFETNLGAIFFAKEVAGLRVIGVTGSLFGSGLERETNQWALLEKELAAPSPLPTVIFSHYPAFEKKADEPGGVYWNIEPEPRARFLTLAKRGGVRALLSGHLHKPLKNEYEGIPLIGATAVSFGLPRGKQAEGWTLITIPPTGAPVVELKEIKDTP
jgi:3',5'-cyclic AMP phosphodiesterase CpdA